MSARTCAAIFLATLLACALAPAARARADASLTFDPAPAAFRNGALFTVTIRMYAPAPVQAFDFDLIFDPAKLKAVVVNGHADYDGNEALLFPTTIDNAGGAIRGLVDASLAGPGPTGGYGVATVVFRVLQSGNAAFAIQAFSGAKGCADAAGAALPGQAEQGTIAIEPSTDVDVDGLPNAYETSVAGTNPNARDTDGDGIHDGSEDADQDGLTNRQEYLLLSHAGDPDSDDDGVPDASDNCSSTVNASQANGDGDARGDACDPDRDNDQLDDVDEAALGLDPALADTDGDGAADGVEVAAGTDPLDPESVPNGIPTLGGPAAALLALVLAGGAVLRLRRAPGPLTRG
jgi:hypothetical protein